MTLLDYLIKKNPIIPLLFFDSETTSGLALAALGSEETLGFAFDFFESPAVFPGAPTAFLLSLIGSGLLTSSFF